ncbi:MAG: ABC transporter ATP-binding protein [Candidatus Marsarchaeota archaeon]|nr:ABC transporter ATP-binding protein [Candidatus Marsarchaeota archaeon]MCL5412991.1 ABC transporter ATP-binding protein [Candidatus Marsarchaeota archaeon]
MAEYAIEIEHLVKRFDNLTAVNDVSLNIRRGEIFGLLGPNGAGKSTTLNMVLGLLSPTSGRVLVNGTDMHTNPYAARNEMGIVTQETVVEPELTAEQNLMIFGRLYHIPEPELRKNIDFALGLADLTSFRNAYAGTFSGGMKRRLETAKSLMHAPSVILLDEPTTGLDIQNRTKIWDLLRDINKNQNVTILLTTQYLEEADQLCDRIGIIDHGRLIALGTPTELRQKIGMNSVIEISADREVLQKVADVFRKIGLEPKILTNKVVAPAGSAATKKIEMLIKELSARKVQIHNISMHEPTIDDVFLKLTGSEVRDTTGDYVGGRAGFMMGRVR